MTTDPPIATDDDALRRKIVSRIRQLRRGENEAENWRRVQHRVEANIDEVVDTFSARWLIAVCDTYADCGTAIEQRNGMLISVFMNMLRLGETVVRMHGAIDESNVARLRDQQPREIILSEMRVLSLDREDTFLNLAKRLDYLLRETPALARIYRALLVRVKASDTIVKTFAARCGSPELILPLAPAGIPDNRGMVLHPIERRARDEAGAQASDGNANG